jgi:hypothetical protein
MNKLFAAILVAAVSHTAFAAGVTDNRAPAAFPAAAAAKSCYKEVRYEPREPSYLDTADTVDSGVRLDRVPCDSVQANACYLVTRAEAKDPSYLDDYTTAPSGGDTVSRVPCASTKA